MPKAMKKMNLEIEGEMEGEKNIGEEKQVKAGKAKKSKPQRFLACLQRAWATITSGAPRHRSKRQKTPDGEFPGPSKMAEIDNKVEVKIQLKAKPEDGGDQSLKIDEEERDKAPTNCAEQQILQHYLEIQEQIQGNEAIIAQYYDALEIKDSEANSCVEGTASNSTVKEEHATVPLTLECFTFHKVLGEGGFGKVLLATDTIRKERVAIKMEKKSVHTEYPIGLAEREILYLSHENPYLVHGLAAFQTECYLYYVMELVTQGSLQDLLMKKTRLDVVTARFITAEMVCALQFLHSKGIVHHDIKPLNILLSREGHIKLIDFGLSKMNVHHKSKGTFYGSKMFAAPEVYKWLSYGRGIDYFALGIILYRMLTGKYPFKGSKLAEIKTSIVSKTPKYPSLLTPESVNILEGLLKKDQNSRLGVVGDIRSRPFFEGLNWNELENKTAAPPKTLVSVQKKTKYNKTLKHTEETYPIKSQRLFTDFSFVAPEWSANYHPTNNIEKTPHRQASHSSKWPFRK